MKNVPSTHGEDLRQRSWRRDLFYVKDAGLTVLTVVLDDRDRANPFWIWGGLDKKTGETAFEGTATIEDGIQSAIDAVERAYYATCPYIPAEHQLNAPPPAMPAYREQPLTARVWTWLSQKVGVA